MAKETTNYDLLVVTGANRRIIDTENHQGKCRSASEVLIVLIGRRNSSIQHQHILRIDIQENYTSA